MTTKVLVIDDGRTEVNMALGRLFSMMARPFQDGDLETYAACRLVVLNSGAFSNMPDTAPCWARDRNKGAKGD